MSEPATTTWYGASAPNEMAPPSVRLPKCVQGVGFAFHRRTVMRKWIKRYGRIFEMNVPIFGRCVVVADPILVRSVFAASAEQLVNVQPNLSNWFGAGSTFGLDHDRHRGRRRLIAPAYHGQSLKNYERLIVDETVRECAKWPENQEFRTLAPMNRITLNVILRTLFGADDPDFETLREIIPPHMRLGQLTAFLPPPPHWARPYGPWKRLAEFRHTFDRIVSAQVDRVDADRNREQRTDVLTLLRRSGMPRSEICDELLTFIGAGHETTATALAWTFERLRRHPDVLAELVDEVREGGSAFRRRTICEVLRVRPVIDVAGRRVGVAHFDLGGWRIPHGRTVLVSIADLHEYSDAHPEPERFDPSRFGDLRPAAPAWLAFGGGTRRCIGAEFAMAEMDVVLHTVLKNFRIHTDAAADEKSYFRGVAHTPRLGGRIVVNHRT